MKKILIITSGFAPVPAVKGGAVETLTTNLITLNEKNSKYKFIVCTLKDKDIKEKDYSNSDFLQVRVSNGEQILEKVINKLYRLFRIKKTFSFFNKKLICKVKKKNIHPDYILFENSMDIFKKIIDLFPNSRYILHMHNDLNDDSKTPEMAKIVSEKAYRILFVSNYLKNRFIRITGCDEEKCFTLYNCMDIKENLMNIEPLKKEKLLKKYGLDLKRKRFIYIGRINSEKGILELTQAFSSLNSEKAELIICGGTWGTEFKSNNYLKEIYKTIEKVKDRVIFTGYLTPNQIKEMYTIADVVVIPSICNEAFGMVMLEAACYKKPIIATKSGGMIEIVPEDAAKFINKDPENIVAELIKAMEEYINNDIEWRKMVHKAYESVIESHKFNCEEYLDRFSKLLD